jgi:hypothetical protein
MADQNPTGSGAAVALNLPANHVRFLRGVFERARAGINDELEEFPDQLEPKRLEREEAVYRRLLAALDEQVIVPDRDVRDLLSDLAGIVDRANEYGRVIEEHDALHGLLARLDGTEGEGS